MQPFQEAILLFLCMSGSHSAALLCLSSENCCCCRLHGFVLRTQAGSLRRRARLAVLISPCVASGQAVDCFSGFVPPGGICLQEKFPYSEA